MKKDSVTDIFEHMSDEEISKIMTLKSGLEDLNLILQEIEDTYELLAEYDLSEQDRKHHKLRLMSLEKYMADLNQKVHSAMGEDEERHKLS
jgi:hypothetical protein